MDILFSSAGIDWFRGFLGISWRWDEVHFMLTRSLFARTGEASDCDFCKHCYVIMWGIAKYGNFTQIQHQWRGTQKDGNFWNTWQPIASGTSYHSKGNPPWFPNKTHLLKLWIFHTHVGLLKRKSTTRGKKPEITTLKTSEILFMRLPFFFYKVVTPESYP